MMKLKFGKIKFIAQDHMSKLLRQCLNLESFNGRALGSSCWEAASQKAITEYSVLE